MVDVSVRCGERGVGDVVLAAVVVAAGMVVVVQLQ